MSFDPSLPDDSVNVSSGSALVEAIWLLAGVAVGTVVLATIAAFLIDRVVFLLPAHLEAKAFGGVATALADEEDPLPVQEPVQALVDRMARHWPDSPYRFHAVVLETEGPNAFALPGGLLMVTTGLLDAVEDENELAFVVAHELGHFYNRDHLRGLGRGLVWSFVGGALGVGEGVAGTVAEVAGTLSNRHFDRDQELEADEFGLRLLVEEYGHAGGARAVFERVLVVDDGEPDEDGPDSVEDWFSTHPAHPDRIEALREIARREGWPGDGPRTAWVPPVAPEPEPD